MLKANSTFTLASNLNTIYMILIGLTDIFLKNSELNANDEAQFYQVDDDEQGLV